MAQDENTAAVLEELRRIVGLLNLIASQLGEIISSRGQNRS